MTELEEAKSSYQLRRPQPDVFFWPAADSGHKMWVGKKSMIKKNAANEEGIKEVIFLRD